MIGRARHPRLVRRGDGLTTVAVDVDEFEGDVFLVITDAGRPTRLLASYRDEDEADTTAVDFDHWNGTVSIEEPAGADVDPTPFIDEEDVAAYDDAALFQPRVIPEGWVLDSANVLADFSFEGDEVGGCDTVSITFFDPEDEEGSGYLSLYLAPASCASERPGSADDFVAGPNAGWIELEEGFATGVLTVGSTVVQFDSGLSDVDLTTILADLVPLDLANPPAATLALD